MKKAVLVMYVFVFFLALCFSVKGATFTCNSCEDCSQKIQSASSGDTVLLTADITNYAGLGDSTDPGESCIKFGGKDDITFDCEGHTISGNGNDYGYGIWLNDSGDGSNNNTIKNCVNISYFGYGISIYESNFTSISNIIVNSNRWDGFLVYYAENNTFINITASNNYRGFFLSYFNFSTLTNITASNNYRSLQISLSNNNTFTNIITNSNQEDGFVINSSDSNIFTNITSSNNYYGFLLSCSDYNILTSIIASFNQYGIYIIGNSDHNNITSSTIQNNTFAGIYLNKSGTSDPEYNYIYNNYLNNTFNIKTDLDVSAHNYFSITKDCSRTNIIGGPCIGGNYWTDPDGGNFSDFCDDNDNDGFCDSEYAFSSIYSDMLPLHKSATLFFVSPTPEDGQVIKQQWIYINVSSPDSQLQSCVLDWNGTDRNMYIHSSGSYCYLNLTGIEEGYYSFMVNAQSSKGGIFTETRCITINLSHEDTEGPNIKYSITPQTVDVDSNISLYINASDPSGIDSVWIILNTSEGEYRIDTENGETINYSVSEEGIYTVFFYANDTLGNEANVSATFTVVNMSSPVEMNITVEGWNKTGISVNITILELQGQEHVTLSSQNHIIQVKDIPRGTYTLLFSALNDKVAVRLRQVNITKTISENISFDIFNNTQNGFGDIYAIETTYNFSNATVVLKYNESDFKNESFLLVNVCHDWDFSQRTCSGEWETVNFTFNETENKIEIMVSQLSAFTIGQAPYCGDDICSSGETAESCSEDCECTPGETRPCNQTHYGVCASGTETCVNGHWEGCPSPENETCNGLDDDCDGTIDNIGGKTTITETQCKCYNGGQPSDETCNGIDDDCDGEIDEGGDCCQNGQTRQCGPSSETGICKFGISTCTNNIWGDCVGAVYPAQNEICFNNEDDNCNGEIDEGCDHCTNNVKDYDEEGVDCGGSCNPCTNYLPIILIVLGAIILAGLIILVLHMKSKGKELTWEELMKKWSPANKR